MSTWATILVALLGGAGFAQIIQAVARRRPTRVEAVAQLNEATIEWAEQLKEDAADARKEASEARREARAAHREIAAVREEAAALAARLRAIVNAIHDPRVDLDQLRLMIPNDARFYRIEEP